MSGIFGWIGNSESAAEAVAAARKMLQPLRVESSVEPIGDKQGAIVCTGKRASIHKHGKLMIAVAGTGHFVENPEQPITAETVATAYLDRGEKILEDLRGPFSLAVIDLSERSALLAIDRIGIEPLYYLALGETLIFGSRADCIASHPRANRSINPQSLFNYLYFHCIPSPDCVYQGQRKLAPSQCVRFTNGQAEAKFYWALSYEDNPAQFAPLREEFRATLERAVRRSSHDDAIGAFLSGGTDSSTVSGLLTQQRHSPTPTYSIGFAAEGYDEMEYARLAVRHFGMDPHEYYVTPQNVVDAIPLISQAYDEPFGNSSAVPSYYCARRAAEDGITALIASDGGDELFAGNARYAHQLMLERYQNVPKALRAMIIEPLALRMPGLQRIPPFGKVRSYIEQAQVPLPDRLETYNFLHRTPVKEMFLPGFLESIDTDEPLANLREVYWRTQSVSALNRMLHLDLKITLADNDLRKVSRMCELAGVEVRYPLLDEEFVEFSARVPPDLKLRQFKLRYFYKQALKDFLPREIITKTKQGFGLPAGIWLRDYEPLRTLAYDSLQSLKGRHYLNNHYIDELIKQHQQGHAAYFGVMIWVLMMLENWLQAHQ